jgi:predicted aminopeptidase
MIRTLRAPVAFILWLTILTGCGNLSYLSKLGWNQGKIIAGSVPVEEALQDKHLSPEDKEKIDLIQAVKCYGEEKMGLKRTNSYSKVFETKGPILYVVTASEKDCLKLLAWDFPIIGQVTYKGFFSEEDAWKEKLMLDRKGYDTFLRPAGAYSTLGWLNDPIFSPMLKWSDVGLTEVILHEMAHNTLYFKGSTGFNEQLATFIGNRGTIDFLKEKHGAGSKEVVKAIQMQEDDLLFSAWIDQACQRMSDFYAQDISRDQKLKGRDRVFQSIQEEFERLKSRFKTGSFEDFSQLQLNNAILLAHHQYMHRLEKFDLLYEDLGKDLRKMVKFFEEIETRGEDPSIYLEKKVTGFPPLQ